MGDIPMPEAVLLLFVALWLASQSIEVNRPKEIRSAPPPPPPPLPPPSSFSSPKSISFPLPIHRLFHCKSAK
jgi:hypothetical protein